MYLKLLCLLFLFLMSTQCKKKDTINNTNGQTSGNLVWIVTAEGGLNIRETPEQSGKILTLIPIYSLVDVMEEVGETIEINGKSGKWMGIRSATKSGYAFGGYIKQARRLDFQTSPNGNYTYEFISMPDPNGNLGDCRQNYMQEGCLVIVYESSNLKQINTFPGAPENWINSKLITFKWSIGDAGFGGEGVKSINIHTKEESDIWRWSTQLKMDGNTNGNEYDSNEFCIKANCFDLLQNPNLKEQLKASSNIKLYEQGSYHGSSQEYFTEINTRFGNFIYYPEKNILVSND